jgi:hypothetical protein
LNSKLSLLRSFFLLTGLVVLFIVQSRPGFAQAQPGAAHAAIIEKPAACDAAILAWAGTVHSPGEQAGITVSAVDTPRPPRSIEKRGPVSIWTPVRGR